MNSTAFCTQILSIENSWISLIPLNSGIDSA